MSKRKQRRPPELTAEETAQVMKNMMELLERERELRELTKKAQLLEKLKKITPTPTSPIRLPTVQTMGVQTFIGKPWGDKRCPVWLPQDPNVPHADRTQCVKFGPHKEHSDTYLIEELSLD